MVRSFMNDGIGKHLQVVVVNFKVLPQYSPTGTGKIYEKTQSGKVGSRPRVEKALPE
jgi:hypothetical protein